MGLVLLSTIISLLIHEVLFEVCLEELALAFGASRKARLAKMWRIMHIVGLIGVEKVGEEGFELFVTDISLLTGGQRDINSTSVLFV